MKKSLLEPPSNPSGVPIVRAVERAIALLRAFTPAKPRQTLTELATIASLDKNTTRRLLHTLAVGGLVEHSDGQYSLSFGLLELFSAVDTGRGLKEAAEHSLLKIAEETSATAFLWVYKDGMAVCVERIRPPNPLVEVTWSAIGSRTTLNSGGGPLALLGHISAAERDVALRQVLVQRTPSSLSDRDALQKRAAEIAATGHALAVDDYVVGLSAIGVPIHDRHRRLLGAISVSSLTEQIQTLVSSDYIPLLKERATEIGRRAL